MENYTKYKLKSSDELAALLDGKDNLFIVACNKCFKEFDTVDEPDCGEFEKIADGQGKTVTGSTRIDFLCNKIQTERKLGGMIPEGTEHVFVVSCGLGVQTMADLAGKPVYAAANSLNYRGHHGMALTKKSCDACAQCYLNITGGVCPIVDCSKSLVNGQCGGAKNGKCEVDSSKDCAWEKIYRRLEKQGRLEEFLNQPVQVRDYSKVNFKFVNDYVKSIRENRLAGYYGGVHPLERKEFTEHLALERFPEPEVVAIPLSMHAGAPATPIVQVGDTVKVGQKIGEAAAFISSPIHSSVSGTVIAIEPRKHATRGECLSVIIRSDGKNTLHESVQPRGDLDSLSPEEIVTIVREAGIVGMGGAGFPTSVKLKPARPVDTILLNGCECEPLLTADHRVLLEFADDVIYGLKAIIRTVGAEKGIIVIEDNKPDAIALLQAKTADISNIDVVAAKTKYPQGAEKMLIKRVMKRQVPSGGLPADVGCVVSNISTTKAISDAIQKGMPLIERVVTVTGGRLKRPGNYIVKIGTNTKDLIEYCGGVTAGAGDAAGDCVSASAGGAADNGVVASAGGAADSGVVASAGGAADSGVVASAGGVADSGVVASAGCAADNGVIAGAGCAADSGVVASAGGVADSVVTAGTGGAADSGVVASAGGAADSGVIADAGSVTEGSLAAGAGGATDSGVAVSATGTVEGGIAIRADGLPGDIMIKAGGPMMGFPLSDVNVPIMKGSNGIIVVDTETSAEQPCIKCGRCMDVCPMELSPLYYAKYADEENWQGMKDKNVMDCIECRCCEYICSSKIPLVSKIKAGKNAVRGMK